jgi:hypothetical protein
MPAFAQWQDRARMKHSSTKELFAYWDKRRGLQLAPERADIEPGDIRRVLADTFILACERSEHPFRLAGTKICALFGRELKGQAFTYLWDAKTLPAIEDLLAVVGEETVGVVASVVGETGDGFGLNLELLLLPLGTKGRGPARLIGTLAPMEIPYWMGVKPLASLILGGLRHVGPAVDRVEPPLFVAAPDNARLRHGLIVHDGGRED